MVNKKFSYFFVTVQFIAISIIVLTTPLSSLSLPHCIVFIAGLFPGMWALGNMKKSKIHAIPDIDKDAVLVTDGPYKYIRHPMYLSALIACLGLLLSNFTLIRGLFYIVLLIDLLLKLNYEEKLLMKHFPEYKKYRKSTYKLIPFIF